MKFLNKEMPVIIQTEHKNVYRYEDEHKQFVEIVEFPKTGACRIEIRVLDCYEPRDCEFKDTYKKFETKGDWNLCHKQGAAFMHLNIQNIYNKRFTKFVKEFALYDHPKELEFWYCVIPFLESNITEPLTSTGVYFFRSPKGYSITIFEDVSATNPEDKFYSVRIHIDGYEKTFDYGMLFWDNDTKKYKSLEEAEQAFRTDIAKLKKVVDVGEFIMVDNWVD